MNLRLLHKEFVKAYKPNMAKVSFHKQKWVVTPGCKLKGADDHCRMVSLRWEAFVRAHYTQFENFVVIPIDAAKEIMFYLPDGCEELKRQLQSAIAHSLSDVGLKEVLPDA